MTERAYDAVFQQPMERLLETIGATRTTLRRPQQDGHYVLIAQALADGVAPLVGLDPADPETMGTLRWVLAHKRPLVQDDCRTADPRPPDHLLDAYGIQSQILVPVLDDGRAIGCISIHSRERRDWTEDDVRIGEAAAAEVLSALAGPRAER